MKLSHPLQKGIQTTEFLIILVANVILVVVPIVTTSLSAGTAAKYAAIMNTGYAFSRSIVKGAALVGTQLGISTSAGQNKTVQVISEDAGLVAGGIATDLESARKPDAA